MKKYGPAIILVTGGANEISLIDPELATEILKRLKEFPQTEMANVIMDIFGPSLLTSNGEAWTRQRKLIAPNLNEKISKLVFGESVRQAHEMLSSYMEDWKGVTDDTMKGMKQVAINVLGTAGFGIRLPWKEEVIKTTERLSYDLYESHKDSRREFTRSSRHSCKASHSSRLWALVAGYRTREA